MPEIERINTLTFETLEQRRAFVAQKKLNPSFKVISRGGKEGAYTITYKIKVTRR